MGKNLFNYTFDENNMYFLDRSINYEEFINYYITENHSRKETLKYFNITNAGFSKFRDHFSIKKPKLLSHEINKKTCLEKYGDPTYNNIQQNKKTCMEKYGVENVFQRQEVIEKIKNKHIEEYGSTENYYKHIVAKGIETQIEKYGKLYSKTEEFKKKQEETFLKKYGVRCPMHSEEIKSKYNFKENSEKAFQTRIKNGTTNTSKPQQILYNELINIFGMQDIFVEYKEERYPYHCDFYIKSLDLFIELNLFFTHGVSSKTKAHLFNPDNEDDIELLHIWEQRAQTSTFYKNAIYVWTVRDVNKHNIAIENNLNYKELYSLEEMYQFIEGIKLLKKDNI